MNRRFVLSVLAGRVEEVGTEAPALEPPEHRSFVGRALAGRDPRRDPLHLAVEDGFRVVRSSMPGGCGGSTASTLHVPWDALPAERRLIGAHEWLHGWAKRLGLVEVTEADVWWCTAVLVQSSLVRGGLAFPAWFEGAIPSTVEPAGRVISGVFVFPNENPCVRVRESG